MEGYPTCIHIAPSARSGSPVQVVIGSDTGDVGVFDHDFVTLGHMHLNSPIVAFASNNGLTLVSASKDGDINVWCLHKKEHLASLKDPHHGVLCLAAFYRCDFFASGSADGFIRQWQVRRFYHGESLKIVPHTKFIQKNVTSAVYGIQATSKTEENDIFFFCEDADGRGVRQFSGAYWLKYDFDECRINVYDFISDAYMGHVSLEHIPRSFQTQTIDGKLYVVYLNKDGMHRLPVCTTSCDTVSTPALKRARMADD
jgi:hypothetical protein